EAEPLEKRGEVEQARRRAPRSWSGKLAAQRPESREPHHQRGGQGTRPGGSGKIHQSASLKTISLLLRTYRQPDHTARNVPRMKPKNPTRSTMLAKRFRSQGT